MSVRVLMVDDSVFVRDVLRHHLECIGCEVVAEAENTLQALDLFRTVAPTLVTLEVAVPHTGGIGALALFCKSCAARSRAFQYWWSARAPIRRFAKHSCARARWIM